MRFKDFFRFTWLKFLISILLLLIAAVLDLGLGMTCGFTGQPTQICWIFGNSITRFIVNIPFLPYNLIFLGPSRWGQPPGPPTIAWIGLIIIIVLYEYLLSCILVWIFNKLKRKEEVKTNSI